MKNLLLAAITLIGFSVNAQNISIKAVPQSPQCHGDVSASIDLVIDGGTGPYTFLWSTGATTQSISNLGAGTYSVTVNDNFGLTSSTTIIINEPAQLQLSSFVINASGPGASDGSIDLSPRGGTFDYSYSWSNGAITQDLSNLAPGDYTVTVTDGFGCVASITRTVTDLGPMHITHNPHSLSDETPGNGMTIPGSNGGSANTQMVAYPNPASNFLSVRVREESEVSIFNNNGQLVMSEKLNPGTGNLNVSTLPTGNYVVRLKGATGTINEKITIAK